MASTTPPTATRSLALLFWCVTRAFGAPHPVFDILVALFVSSLAYLGFAVALGLTLPSGILGGGF